MKIRQEQMDAFSQSLEGAFVARMVRHLRESFPQQRAAQGLREDELPGFVRQGMIEARRYGLIYEDDVQTFLECKVILGARFDRDERHPDAINVLHRRDLEGAQKADQLREYVIFGLEDPPT